MSKIRSKTSFKFGEDGGDGGVNVAPTFQMFSEHRSCFGGVKVSLPRRVPLPKITSVNHLLLVTGDVVLFVQHEGYCILLLTSQPVFSTYITQRRSRFTHIIFFFAGTTFSPRF